MAPDRAAHEKEAKRAAAGELLKMPNYIKADEKSLNNNFGSGIKCTVDKCRSQSFSEIAFLLKLHFKEQILA